MSTSKRPAAPAGVGAAARRLWNQVLERYDLDEHERALLAETVRTVDVLERLDAVVRREGVTLEDGKPHPAIVEQRQMRITLARLVTALRLPEDAVADGRPQRRGVRGVYAMRGA